MRRTIIGAVTVAFLLLLATSRPASAQGLSSLAAAMSSASSLSLEKKAGCWSCGKLGEVNLCEGGQVPGYYNCTASPFDCRATSSGCGGPITIQLDPDGGTQFVSRASHMGIPVVMLAGDPNVRRNCDGVVVARIQSSGDISEVRNRTGILSL